MVATINIMVTTQGLPLARKYVAYTMADTDPFERISASSRPPSGGAVADRLSTELTWRLSMDYNYVICLHQVVRFTLEMNFFCKSDVTMGPVMSARCLFDKTNL